MRLLYPAIFYPWSEKEGYTVIVPDLPGCVSEGDSLADAIIMATDAASGWSLLNWRTVSLSRLLLISTLLM